jgi:topoisomerase IV subunit A
MTHDPDQHASLGAMYSDYFLDYASYVILERAVPHLYDGLKPVQRRILHAMDEIDDGRYNKVAGIVGNTMNYHPHGDMSISAAIVQLGQKDLLIDTQGNWGNTLTGDGAAAPRYIEARLTKFANEVVFNPKTTKWLPSYDGRRKEPDTLPVKFPLLLAQGVEGIAVGLACKVLPHNFNELIEASIAVLRNEPFTLLPDFPTGGIMDASDYRDGLRGGKVRVRARISVEKKGMLRITEIPFGTTTGALMDSIVAAADKGKIKIQKIEDNTAANADILVHLPAGADAETTRDALFAFSDCELTISPNACVIADGKPQFLGVSDILKRVTQQTRELLKLELEIKLAELAEKWHFSSLEKIFIENRIYRDIEECTTWEAVLKAIDDGLKPFKKLLKREVTEEDLVRLTEIKIKRISKFDSFKADEEIKGLEKTIEETEKNLRNLTKFTIKWYRGAW